MLPHGYSVGLHNTAVCRHSVFEKKDTGRQEVTWAPPSGLGRLFGGSGRHERQEVAARAVYEEARAQHTKAEADRLRQLTARRREYERGAAAAVEDAAAYNAEVDQFELDFRNGEQRR